MKPRLIMLLVNLALLASLVERRAGGQHRLPLGRPGSGQGPSELPAPLISIHGEAPLAEAGTAAEPWPAVPAEAPSAPAPGAKIAPRTDATSALPSGRGRRQPARYGLTLQFAHHPDDPELARLVESTVWINDAHPAYRRQAPPTPPALLFALDAASRHERPPL